MRFLSFRRLPPSVLVRSVHLPFSLPRTVTTKLKASEDVTDARINFDASLKKLGLSYVDLCSFFSSLCPATPPLTKPFHRPHPLALRLPQEQDYHRGTLSLFLFPPLAKLMFLPSVQETWKVLEKIKDEGLAKSIGVSNFRIRDIEKILAIPDLKHRPVVNQIEFQPFQYEAGEDLYQFRAHSSSLFLQSRSRL